MSAEMHCGSAGSQSSLQDFRGLESAVGPNKEGFSLLPPLSQSLGTWSPKVEPDLA